MLLIRMDKPYPYNMHEKEEIVSDALHICGRRSPDLAMVAAPRGRIIRNSVNSPRFVSTSI